MIPDAGCGAKAGLALSLTFPRFFSTIHSVVSMKAGLYQFFVLLAHCSEFHPKFAVGRISSGFGVFNYGIGWRKMRQSPPLFPDCAFTHPNYL